MFLLETVASNIIALCANIELNRILSFKKYKSEINFITDRNCLIFSIYLRCYSFYKKNGAESQLFHICRVYTFVVCVGPG